jgi:hypothetical protein
MRRFQATLMIRRAPLDPVDHEPLCDRLPSSPGEVRVVSDLNFMLVRLSIACALVCMASLTHAAQPASAAAVTPASDAASSASMELLSPRPFVGDDPVAIRNALAEQNNPAGQPSLSDRVRKLLHVSPHQAPHDTDASKAGPNRELTFVVPASYGILYRSTTHVLTVDIDLSDDGNPGAILLRKTVAGQSGRRLVVAPEAKAKGYIQHIDQIQLMSGEGKKTRVHGRVTLSRAAFAEANGDFAILLMCTATPPYLTDRNDHSDPTDDEPTDITTRTSTLYASIHAIWLISPQKGIVLSKKLHLSK